jgi:hypothetical protein
MRQGTSLLVPKTPHFEQGFRQCLTNLKSSGFVTGHGFSRAEKRAKNGGVLTPEGCFSIRKLDSFDSSNTAYSKTRDAVSRSRDIRVGATSRSGDLD